MPVRTDLVFFSIYSLATTSENYTIKCKISLEFLLPMDIYTSSWTGHRNHKKMQHPPLTHWPLIVPVPQRTLSICHGANQHLQTTKKTYIFILADWRT